MPITPSPGKFIITGVDVAGEPTAVTLTLSSHGPIDAPAIYAMLGRFVTLRSTHDTTPHPTRTIDARITCIWTDGYAIEITVEDAVKNQWRLFVADAEPYQVGSTIRLEVPA